MRRKLVFAGLLVFVAPNNRNLKIIEKISAVETKCYKTVVRKLACSACLDPCNSCYPAKLAFNQDLYRQAAVEKGLEICDRIS